MHTASRQPLQTALYEAAEGAREEGRCHRRVDRRHPGGIDPRRGDQARRRPYRGREPWDGAGDPIPAGELFPTGSRTTRRAICSSWTRPAAPVSASRRPPTPSILAGTDDPVRRPRPCARRTRSPPYAGSGDPRARRAIHSWATIKLEEVTSASPRMWRSRSGPSTATPPSASASSPKRKTSSCGGRQQGDGRGSTVPRLGAEQGRARGAVGRPRSGRRSTARSIIRMPAYGGLVSVDGRQLAVYRDDDGNTVELLPRCTHMGCTVDWNDSARTWDCPCHGSRFAADASVVHGPASEPLERPAARRRPPAAPAASDAEPASRRIGARRPRRASGGTRSSGRAWRAPRRPRRSATRASTATSSRHRL